MVNPEICLFFSSQHDSYYFFQLTIGESNWKSRSWLLPGQASSYFNSDNHQQKSDRDSGRETCFPTHADVLSYTNCLFFLVNNAVQRVFFFLTSFHLLWLEFPIDVERQNAFRYGWLNQMELDILQMSLHSYDFCTHKHTLHGRLTFQFTRGKPGWKKTEMKKMNFLDGTTPSHSRCWLS